MFMALMALVVVASAPLCGGRLSRFADVRIARSWLLFVALLIQILITEVARSGPRVVLVGLHLLTYAMAGVAIWANRQLPGLVVLSIGALLNLGTIALNGGTLPASARAMAEVGIKNPAGEFTNSGSVAHPILPWFGDIMATPDWLPFRNVLSIGDMLILVGTVLLVHGVCDTVPARAVRRWRTTRRTAAPVGVVAEA